MDQKIKKRRIIPPIDDYKIRLMALKLKKSKSQFIRVLQHLVTMQLFFIHIHEYTIDFFLLTSIHLDIRIFIQNI